MTSPETGAWKQRRKRAFRWLRRGLAAAAVLVTVYLAVLYFTLPDIGHLVDENPSMTNYIREWAARTNAVAEDYAITDWTPIEEIAPLLVQATIYSEDTGFHDHDGVEWDLTRKMAWRYINGRRATGVSTINQQLARNLFLSGEFSITRKVREIMLALKLDRLLPKERVVELYLNVIEWGEGVWGITKASEYYFGKAPADLDSFECVFFPSILPAPRKELFGSNLYRAGGVWRRICFYMHRQEKMSLDEWVTAKRGLGELEIQLKEEVPLREAIKAAQAAVAASPE